MVKRVNWIAKAIAAWAVPTAAALASWATVVTDATEDGFVSGAEWQLIVVGLIAGVVTFLKANGPAPAG